MNRFLKGAVFYLLLFIIIIGIVQFSGTKTTQVEELEFSKVYKYLTEENISRIHFIEGTSVTGKIKDSNKEFTSYIPNEVLGDKLANEILNQAAENKLVIDGEAQPQTPWFVSMLPTVLLIGFMIIIWFVFMNQSQGGGGKVMSFGKSRARVHKDDEKTRVTFKDVAGLTEEKEDLREVVDFLNECSKTHKVVLLNDIAYIDFAYGQAKAKEYYSVFDGISDNMAVIVAFSLSKSMTSYGLRCGAAIIMAQQEEIVQEIKIVFEKEARATWSNINNGAMAMFVDVLENHLDEYNKERNYYVNLLKERSDIFVKEANEVGLKHYPYKEGFFVTLSMDNETRDKYHEALMANHIYTVKVNKGIRVAVCSLSLDKIKGLAKKMKDILDSLN